MEQLATKSQGNRSCVGDVVTRPPAIKLDTDGWMQKEEDAVLAEFSHPVPWQKIEAQGLDLDYALLFSKEEADGLFQQLEEEVVYSAGITPKTVCSKYHCRLGCSWC